MIDVKSTILETIKDKIKKLRFLGKNDTIAFKKILSLIVLDDLYEWSNYLDDSQAVQKKLQDLRVNYILCQKDFNIQYFPQENFYVNVNTPQTNYTWVRMFDSKDLTEVSDIIYPSTEKPEQPTSFVPDPSCPISLVYFGGPNDPIPAEDPVQRTGHPDVDLNKLTTCEKMNIYINRETGKTYFLDSDTCTWKPLKGEFIGELTWNNISGKPTIYNGIEHHVNSNNDQFVVSLNTSGHTSSSIPVTNINEDLDDVL